MRWILVVVAILGLGFGLSAKTPGVMALGLLLGFGCMFASVFAFAAARIASTARPDAALLTDKDVNALRASVRKPAAATGNSPPAANDG